MYRCRCFRPVKVTVGEVAFLHTAVVPLMVAAGNGLTVTTRVATPPQRFV